MNERQELQRRVRIARGEEPGDLLLRGGLIVNIFTERIEPGNVVISDGQIAGVGPHEWQAKETIDVSDRLIAPGLIDAHIHIESTLLTPAELARVIVPRGTTAIVADPHEVGNVLGVAGIEQMLRASEGIPLDCFFMAPSCVPASPFENPGAVLEHDEIQTLMRHDRVLGLAEMMNFPGVLAGDEGVMNKIAAARRAHKRVDGHCPGLLGRDLIAYVAAGIESDHECTTVEEARQRAALGMLVQVREGSMARNLDTMLPLILEGALPTWCLCTDDILPEDLLMDGHLDGLLRRVVKAGVPLAHAIRHTSLVPANHYGLRHRGAIAPGYRADIAIFDREHDLQSCMTIKDGIIVARDGEASFEQDSASILIENTVNFGELSSQQFELHLHNETQSVIGIIEDQIVTRHESIDGRFDSGVWQWDAAEDVALLACVQRHRPNGDVGLGLVRGFGFHKRGALGSTVGHDAHNLMLVGTHPEELLACAHALRDMQGGFATVIDGVPAASLPLPFAGLMSIESVDDVCRKQRAINEAARSLGCPLHSPFGTLSFLPLTVIPELRLTDRGMFDVEKFELIAR